MKDVKKKKIKIKYDINKYDTYMNIIVAALIVIIPLSIAIVFTF